MQAFFLVACAALIFINVALYIVRRSLPGYRPLRTVIAESLNPRRAPIPEHIKKQRKQGPPFYCGAIFCGHQTMRAAAACWQRHCDLDEEKQRRCAALEAEGKHREARAYRESVDQVLYPHLNPANWPINRTSESLRSEYIARAKREGSW